MNPMNEPGYEKLADVLQRAFDQAASGKGKERHAQGEPFHEQVMQIGARKFGVGSLLFQAFKKSEESQRLEGQRGVNELLGAIVYLAGAVIAREAAEGICVADGWIEWDGGKECPVEEGTAVEIFNRRGQTLVAKVDDFGDACFANWVHGSQEGPTHPSDILRYRLVTNG